MNSNLDEDYNKFKNNHLKEINKIRRIPLLITSLIILASISSVAVLPDLKSSSSNLNSNLFLIVCLAVITPIVAKITSDFLTAKTKRELDLSSIVIEKDEYINKNINDIHARLVTLESLSPDGGLHAERINEQKKLLDELVLKIKVAAGDEILDQLRQQIKQKDELSELRGKLKFSTDRIEKEIDALSRRGTVNLIYGTITALIGIILLGYITIMLQHNYVSFFDFTMAFLPRLSVVVLIEVFAYFFLRLYKSSLAEIKYFQNESTNIEYHHNALLVGINQNDNTLISEVIKSYLKIERNPILAADQRLEALEVEKLYSKASPLSVQHLTGIIEAVLKANKKADE